MKNDLIGNILDTVARAAEMAEWKCDVNRDLSMIRFTAEIPGNEDYEFLIAYGNEAPSELIGTISGAITRETYYAASTEFIVTLLHEYQNLSLDDGSVYSYSDSVSSKLKALSDNVTDALIQASRGQIRTSPTNVIKKTDGLSYSGSVGNKPIPRTWDDIDI